jgi:hypothetical protein
MAKALQQQLALLRGRVRRLMLIYGLSAVVAASLAAILLLGLGDYLIHFQDRGIRVICWLAVAGVLGWSIYRWGVRPMTARLGDAELAVRLQQRFSSLDDGLLSAVEFLGARDDDPTAGSATLRRAVIAEVDGEAQRLDFAEVLDRRRPLRAVLALLAVGLAAATAAALDPASARIAAARLLDPFSDAAWPQVTHLALRQPVSRVARGQPLEIEVVDARGARLPAAVRIHWRFEESDGKTSEAVERMQLFGGAMFARRENVTRPLEFRVEGGDDRSMLWQPVEVIDPPATKSLLIELFPPEYTGWPAEKIETIGGFHALVGTRVRMRGAATKPLRSAVLSLEGGRRIPAAVEQDGLHFTIGGSLSSPAAGNGQSRVGRATRAPPSPLVIEKSGAYWFELTDLDGLTGGSEARSEIVAVVDQPPTVTIEQPAADLFVTPRAVVPLHVTSRDDLALREVGLVAGRSDGSAPKEILVKLYAGPDRAPPRPAASRAADAEPGERRELDYRWELDALKLAPGTQLVFYATATDYLPQTGKSEPRRLSVVTAEELQVRIAARQNLLLAELARVLRLQRDSRQQVAGLEVRVREAGSLGQLDLDRLQAAELGQRQVGRNLTSRHDGVAMLLVALLADLENNRLDSPDFQRRARWLLAEIERLEHDSLPLVGRELTAAIKSAQIRLQEQAPPHRADAATAESLARAGKGQQDVIAALEVMLGQLRRWDDYRRFHRDVAQLLRDQQEVSAAAAAVGRLTLTKDVKDLTPQETADLKVSAGRQLELARRLDRILQEMEQAAVELRPTDPLAADTLVDALDEARRSALAAAMRTAAALVEENRIGRAAETHKQIAADLQEVLDILANRRQQELSRLVQKLSEAEGELRGIRQRQELLRHGLETAGSRAKSEPPRDELRTLGRSQEELRQATERLARLLERLLAELAGQTAQRAAADMGRAGAAATQGDSTAAVREARIAEDSLDETMRRLAARRLTAQAELAIEQLARLEDALKLLRRQQGHVLDETRGLEALGQRGLLGRAEIAGLLDLARLEQSLRVETARLAGIMTAAGPFHLVLAAAETEMGQAAALLDARQTGTATQEAEQRAIERLDLILKALEPEKSGSGPSGGDGGGDQEKPGPQPEGVQSLSEIKLLKLLQEEINLRTQKLAAAVAAAGKVSDEHRQAFTQLSADQGRLAEMVEGGNPQGENGDGPKDPLVQIARDMREVQSRIAARDAGPVTRHIEGQIIDDLDQLMEDARKQALRSQTGAESTAGLRPPTGTQNPPPNGKPSGKNGGTPGEGPAKQSSEDVTRRAAERAAELLKREHELFLKAGTAIGLPPRDLLPMLDLPAEEVLPKYEVLIEEYFKRLSQPKDRREYER